MCVCVSVCVCVLRQGTTNYNAQSGYADEYVDVVIVYGGVQMCLPLLAINYLYSERISFTVCFLYSIF
jgi:hypothetical protein